ncbi:SAM-dependent methyltransferase [Allostreptomyces psammosilenae]|uniref:SAM-dependent methyltransferase n=1 Tax=Allostreptomyces psammosilenae TaxID=1892865 RepID=A0A852ZQ68_9ACTN|nr:class I SAM-dependent methyltransferase [Allostreptomyces psammosilenae]NYI04543.1 SAM-dependent methyltransferase [Allostreptomyces psammosilenae]
MDRQRISAIAHGDHPIAAPLSEESVARLLDRAVPSGTGRLLDLGCGTGTWLRRALADRPGLRADGVDTDAAAIAAGREAAAAEGLADRLALHVRDATEFTAAVPYDLVLCVGATHAFGGLFPALEAARRHLAPGGGVLVGDGFWERAPDRGTLEAGFAADEYDDLATTVDRITAAGWAPVYGHVSTGAEWDEYEWSWTGTLTRWALDHPEDPGGEAALRAASEHRAAWLHGYRGTLGFVTLLLRRTP